MNRWNPAIRLVAPLCVQCTQQQACGRVVPATFLFPHTNYIERYHHVRMVMQLIDFPACRPFWCTSVSTVDLIHCSMAENFAEHFSLYACTVSRDAKKRYKKKISLINGAGPFLETIPAAEITSNLPPVDASDLLSYLVVKSSFITLAQFKARKSLVPYNQFVCGWVKDVISRKISGRYLTCGRVSQILFSFLRCIYPYGFNLATCNCRLL